MDANENADRLFSILYDKEFDMRELKAELSTGLYSPEDINRAALDYADLCANDFDDPNWEFRPKGFGELLPGYESSHMPEAFAVLLEYGLDPNAVFRKPYERNVMAELRSVYNGYAAADTLALLLEHGGNPNIILNGNSLIQNVNLNVWFDLTNEENRIRYDALVHYWMVLIGYGAKLENGESVLKPIAGFDIAKLRNHRNYYYGAIHSETTSDHMEFCLFDKRTNWEVARY